MAGKLFNAGAFGLCSGTIVYATDVIRGRLVETSQEVDTKATSMTGIGLPATDIAVGGRITSPVKDDTNDRVVYNLANPTFPSVAAGPEINRMVLFKFITNDAGSVPIAIIEIDPTTPTGVDIAVTVDPAGAFYLQA